MTIHHKSHTIEISQISNPSFPNSSGFVGITHITFIKWYATILKHSHYLNDSTPVLRMSESEVLSSWINFLMTHTTVVANYIAWWDEFGRATISNTHCGTIELNLNLESKDGTIILEQYSFIIRTLKNDVIDIGNISW